MENNVDALGDNYETNIELFGKHNALQLSLFFQEQYSSDPSFPLDFEEIFFLSPDSEMEIASGYFDTSTTIQSIHDFLHQHNFIIQFDSRTKTQNTFGRKVELYVETSISQIENNNDDYDLTFDWELIDKAKTLGDYMDYNVPPLFIKVCFPINNY